MTSAAMTPIPNKNLVRLFTTVSPTHLTTLLVSRLLRCRSRCLWDRSNQPTSVRSPEPIMLFSLRSPFPLPARLVFGGSGYRMTAGSVSSCIGAWSKNKRPAPTTASSTRANLVPSPPSTNYEPALACRVPDVDLPLMLGPFPPSSLGPVSNKYRPPHL